MARRKTHYSTGASEFDHSGVAAQGPRFNPALLARDRDRWRPCDAGAGELEGPARRRPEKIRRLGTTVEGFGPSGEEAAAVGPPAPSGEKRGTFSSMLFFGEAVGPGRRDGRRGSVSSSRVLPRFGLNKKTEPGHRRNTRSLGTFKLPPFCRKRRASLNFPLSGGRDHLDRRRPCKSADTVPGKQPSVRPLDSQLSRHCWGHIIDLALGPHGRGPFGPPAQLA